MLLIYGLYFTALGNILAKRIKQLNSIFAVILTANIIEPLYYEFIRPHSNVLQAVLHEKIILHKVFEFEYFLHLIGIG